MTNTIFVVGHDPFTGSFLDKVRTDDAHEYRTLLSLDEAVRPPEDLRFDDLLATCEERLAEHERAGGTVDGIISWWDFPSVALVPLLRQRRGLPACPLSAIAACEHKYFARKEQAKVVPEMIPNFAAVDPGAEDPKRLEIDYPFWLKPVVGHSSFLGFRINDEADFDEALRVVRQRIGYLRDPVDQFLAHAGWPDGTDEVSGDHMIAEAIISEGEQCTLEGYVHDGEVGIHGIVDTARTGAYRQSLSSYRYPSALPESVQERMIEATGKIMRQVGYDHAAFNIEFFWYERDDSLKLLEVNSRVSKSHSPLFQIADGAPNQQVLVDLNEGLRPRMPRGEGSHRIARKHMIRLSREDMDDGIVKRVPTRADMDRLRETYPEAHLQVLVEEGQRLSSLEYQDSYSYELADLFIGGDSEAELDEKYERCQQWLPFDFEAVGKAA